MLSGTFGGITVTPPFAAAMSLDRTFVRQTAQRYPETHVGRAAAAWLQAYASSRAAGCDELGARYRAAEAWNGCADE